MINPDIAVLDVETTGVYPSSDRVIEVGIVRMNMSGVTLSEYVTLINPRRDVGDSNIHGITAGQLKQAPQFQEVAGDIAEMLDGAAVAGHSVSFDLRMMGSEFRRIGHILPEVEPICTMRLASKFEASARNLHSCCLEFGVEQKNWHSALDDAQATAKLLLQFADLARQSGLPCILADSVPISGLPALPKSGKCVTRSESNRLREENGYLRRLISMLPPSGVGLLDEYIAALDRALEDRAISDSETEELIRLAMELGLTRDDAARAHKLYMQQLCKQALLDGVVTDAERRDLVYVGNLLGMQEVEALGMLQSVPVNAVPSLHQLPDTSAAVGAAELAGKSVCFTGALTCSIGGKPITRNHALSMVQSAGLLAMDSVTKKLDILVVADPDTISGKAEKARKYGTRILAEHVFWQKLGINVD